VLCLRCKHPSDTFEAFLDLSLDIARADDVRESLEAFVRKDKLTGSNRYKCERCVFLLPAKVRRALADPGGIRCKASVDALKSFSIDKAPAVLTLHLKRFTPTGRKINGLIRYDEELDLAEYTSDGEVRLQTFPPKAGFGLTSFSYVACQLSTIRRRMPCWPQSQLWPLLLLRTD
jgi:ubiquitin carboxyl-terminal hydrolase 36/42